MSNYPDLAWWMMLLGGCQQDFPISRTKQQQKFTGDDTLTISLGTEVGGFLTRMQQIFHNMQEVLITMFMQDGDLVLGLAMEWSLELAGMEERTSMILQLATWQ
ncbi:hypothetical protein KDL29_10310 [bacterium]|nr:hypothetical protein [bacterium]